MSYPGDPAGGQPAYPYNDGQNQYQPPAPQPGGYGAPQPGFGGEQPGAFGAPQPQSAPPAGQPYSGQPFSGQPFSSPPASGQPYSGVPASGQPYQPTPAFGADPGPAFGGYDPNQPSGLPTSGGFGPAAAPPAGNRRSPALAVFASLAVLFLLATAVLTVLYFTKNGDYNEQKKTAAERQDTVNSLTTDLNKTKEDLKKAQDDLAATKRDLGGAQGQADELKRQKQIIAQCIRLLAEAGDAAEAGNAALAAQKQTEAQPICQQAGQYLDD